MSDTLKTWWDAIDAQPGEILLLGLFADELTDMGHKFAPAIRWAFEKKRIPLCAGHTEPYRQWYWFSDNRALPSRLLKFRGDINPSSMLPSWLMLGNGNFSYRASYKTCSRAYRSLCKRFLNRETKNGLNEGMFAE